MNQEPEQLRHLVVSRLVQNGINPTRQRVEIGLCLFDSDKHITADQLLEQVNHSSSEVSKATVYNTLGLFAAKGLLREVVVDPGKQIYDTNTSLHHHIYNTDTGELKDVGAQNLTVSGLPALEEGIEIEGVDIVVRVKNRRD
jgi:Fur family iron response transcriptional regulator